MSSPALFILGHGHSIRLTGGNPNHDQPLRRFEGLQRIPTAIPLLVAWIPVLIWYVKRLDDGSDEPLGLLALALTLALAWRDRHSLVPTPQARITGALLVLASVLSIGTLPPLLRAGLAVLGTGTWFGMHRRPGLLGLALLSLPLVASLQFYLGYPMRLAAASGTVGLLDLCGLVASRHGVGVSIGGSSINVDPACSGIRMLWHALAAAMTLAAFHRLSWKASIAAALLAVTLILPANILRAFWLTLEESGRFQGMGVSHEGVGLVCFATALIPLWWWISRHARPAAPAAPSSAPGRTGRSLLHAAAVLTPVFMWHATTPDDARPPAILPATFSFNGLTLPLTPLPSSATERAFAKSFPGTLSSHTWGERQVILRQVTRATRRLHPSGDCLRAAGYQTSHATVVRCADGHEWSRFHASRDGTRLIVHERIISEQDGSTWTDVPSWFWSALRHPLNGPWRAETVISR